jgi:hypothetical protein
MNRIVDVLRVIALAGFLAGVALLFAPVRNSVDPLPLPEPASVSALPLDTRANADSLTEDIILYNLFSPSRIAPSRRYAATGGGDQGQVPDANESMSPSAGFSPVLMGTAVSARPGETRALLQLIASDPTPRLYAVGDRAGGYSVVSIDARAVVLTGPRGRVVLRLPENEENHS